MNKKHGDVVNSSTAVKIWNEGVKAAGAEQVVRDSIGLCENSLSIAGETFDLGRLEKIIVVGFGKCSGAMAAGFESAVGQLQGIELSGLVIVPEGQAASTKRILTTVGRQRASNFPTQTVVEQTQRMLDMIADAGENTLIVALVSGGGSALLEAQLVPLDDLIAVSKALSSRGAPIESLNTVRRAISGVKAGGLARHVLEHSAARMVGLIISDVIGDSLAMVASGPTVISDESVQQQRLAARKVLLEFELQDTHSSVFSWLEQEATSAKATSTSLLDPSQRIRNRLIATNTTAVNAARIHATDIGLALCPADSVDVNRDVNIVAGAWAELAMKFVDGHQSQDRKALTDQAVAIVAGGEPTVVLCDSPGQGGRNLQLTALVLQKLSQRWGAHNVPVAFVSGGTDGEDGSAPVAGASFDFELMQALLHSSSLQDELKNAILANDCDAFFTRHGNRLPPPRVSTNVCDLQVMLIGPRNEI